MQRLHQQNNKFVATTLISASHVLSFYYLFLHLHTAQINLIEMPSVFYSVGTKHFRKQRVYNINYLLMLGINIKTPQHYYPLKTIIELRRNLMPIAPTCVLINCITNSNESQNVFQEIKINCKSAKYNYLFLCW